MVRRENNRYKRAIQQGAWPSLLVKSRDIEYYHKTSLYEEIIPVNIILLYFLQRSKSGCISLNTYK